MSDSTFPRTSADLPMNGPDAELIRWLVRFADWTRPQTMRAIARATPEQLGQPGVIAGGHGDGSVLAAYEHLVGSEDYWLSRWMRTSLEWDDSGEPTLESINRRWERLIEIRTAWLANLTADDLGVPLMEMVAADGTVANAPLWTAIVHVLFHSGHHRAEIYEALTKFGVPPAEEPDLIDFAGAEAGIALPFSLRFLG